MSRYFAKKDSMTGVNIGIAYAHHEIHGGSSFLVDHIEVGTGFSLCFKVPSGTKRVHMVIQWAAESKAEVSLMEGTGWDASSGSLVAIYNRNRNSGNSSILEENQSTGSFIANDSVILNPDDIGVSGNDAGVEIHHWEEWSDKKVTGRARGTSEWILENDQVYVAKFISNDAGKGGQVVLDWYEHTDN